MCAAHSRRCVRANYRTGYSLSSCTAVHSTNCTYTTARGTYAAQSAGGTAACITGLGVTRQAGSGTRFTPSLPLPLTYLHNAPPLHDTATPRGTRWCTGNSSHDCAHVDVYTVRRCPTVPSPSLPYGLAPWGDRPNVGMPRGSTVHAPPGTCHSPRVCKPVIKHAAEAL